jgi:hypothetical protein
MSHAAEDGNTKKFFHLQGYYYRNNYLSASQRNVQKNYGAKGTPVEKVWILLMYGC